MPYNARKWPGSMFYTFYLNILMFSLGNLGSLDKPVLADLNKYSDYVVVDYCHFIQLDHNYSENAGYKFTQIIFWDEYGIIDYRTVKGEAEVIDEDERRRRQGILTYEWQKKHPGLDAPEYSPPIKYWKIIPIKVNNEYRIRFQDNDILREVRAPLFEETWTQVDIEVIDKANNNGIEHRRQLYRPEGVNNLLNPPTSDAPSVEQTQQSLLSPIFHVLNLIRL